MSDSRLAGIISAVGLIGNVAWFVVAIAGAVALHKAGAGKWVVIATCVSTVFVVHVVPAAIGLVAFAVAGILRERQGASSERAGGQAALVGR